MTNGNNANFVNTIFRDSVYNTPRSAAHACAAGAEISGFRYALMENTTLGETLAVMTWRPLVKATPCPDDIEKYTSALVFRLQAKAMEQKMATVTASEISQSRNAKGKVAIYGILFDSGKRRSSPSPRLRSTKSASC